MTYGIQCPVTYGIQCTVTYGIQCTVTYGIQCTVTYGIQCTTVPYGITKRSFQEPITRKPHIVPICMPRIDAGDFLDNMGIVTGWGRLEYGKLVFFLNIYQNASMFRKLAVLTLNFSHGVNTFSFQKY